MSTKKSLSIILRCRPFSETSTIADLLTREHGLLRVIAKGNRRPKSPLHGRIREFSLGEATYLTGYSDGLRLLKNFQPLQGSEMALGSLENAALFYYCGELVSAAAVGPQQGEGLFPIFSDLLNQKQRPHSPQTAALWFEINWLAVLGRLPALEHCTKCRKPLRPPIYLAENGEGLFCDSCKPQGRTLVLSPGLILALRHLSQPSPEKARRLRLSPSQGRAASRLVRSLIDRTLDKPIKSRCFFDSVLAQDLI